MNLIPPILEERKNDEFADSSRAVPALTIDEGEFDYDLTLLDTDEHAAQDFEEKLKVRIDRVQHPNRDYIRKWKSKGIPCLANHRR